MPLILEIVGVEVVVGMLGLIDGLAGYAIFLARPGAEIDHLASLGTKRPEGIGRRHVNRLLANRASHHFRNCQIPTRIATRRLSIRIVNQNTSWLPQRSVPPACLNEAEYES